ncbi:MAG: phospholipase D family protein [Herminiimonas sp.]|uniref:phospholipase D-like domain-containing protein n=1 Tax=Herminiimonas sp. TaxID=1926289 RepID=UPI0027231A51|nr:phospholipase D family protein [Herminiimonas sp.]MDO9420498.1 phospholipase D family protein [Herminiimonas sp.]
MRIKQLKHLLSALLLSLPLSVGAAVGTTIDTSFSFIDDQIAAHQGQSGIYVLDSGAEALMARAWLADHAQQTIEVQYFIWSTDNIGALAAEALLRAAKRGVQVNVIVDDLLIDAEDKTLIALSRHPNIDIRIYNPKNSVGVPLQKRVLNLATDFRGVNQRMHNKTFIVDGKVAITGGRNMAAEYYDYHQEFNFRDRDALLLGEVVTTMQFSFREFWESELSVPVAQRYNGLGLMKKHVEIDENEVIGIQKKLHEYAESPSNFATEVRNAINEVGPTSQRMTAQIAWGKADFISDKPGKNDSLNSLSGGGFSTTALAQLIEDAQESIVIQSPYLVMSDAALELFKRARARGVQIRINTNSLASTDNLPAFSGYRNQRKELLGIGLEIFEYKPDAATQRQLMQKSGTVSVTQPTTALHAKTLIVDSKIAYIGTFNLDPRSENLNTEAGVIIYNEELAQKIEAVIEVDMQAENSWNAATDDPDQYVPITKRSKLRMFQMMPIKPLL